jgi:hypothetical protein
LPKAIKVKVLKKKKDIRRDIKKIKKELVVLCE